MGDFDSGPGPRTLALAGFPASSPLICYEVLFPGEVTGRTPAGVLLNVTNDAWFGSRPGRSSILLHARFQGGGGRIAAGAGGE